MQKFTKLLFSFFMVMCVHNISAQTDINGEQILNNERFLHPININFTKPIFAGNYKSRSKKDSTKVVSAYNYTTWNTDLNNWSNNEKNSTITWDSLTGMPKQVITTGYLSGKPARNTGTDFIVLNKDFSDPNFFFPGEMFSMFALEINGKRYHSKNIKVEVQNAGVWSDHGRYTTKFSPEGKIVEYLYEELTGNTWVTQHKWNWQYNSNLDLVKETIYSLSMGTTNRTVFTYDNQNNITEIKYEDSTSGGWKILQGSQRYVYTYNNQEQITAFELLQYISDLNSWEKMLKEEYAYNSAGEINSATKYNYYFIDNEWKWQAQGKFDNIIWQKFYNGRTVKPRYGTNHPLFYPLFFGGTDFISYDLKNFRNNAWVLVGRARRTYTLDSKPLESIYETYYGSDTFLSINQKEVYTYYNNGDDKSYTSWQDQLNNGKITIRDQYEYKNTYDAEGDIILRIRVRNYSDYKMLNRNETREIFSYSKIAFVGLEDAFISREIKLFPNPVTAGNVTIQLDKLEKNAAVNVSVFDNTGKMVILRSETSSRFQIDFNGLPKGMYFINIENGKTVSKGKVIVQ